jgi:hypothetical protein
MSVLLLTNSLSYLISCSPSSPPSISRPAWPVKFTVSQLLGDLLEVAPALRSIGTMIPSTERIAFDHFLQLDTRVPGYIYP